MKRLPTLLRSTLVGLSISGLALTGPACGSKDSANPAVSAESKSSAEAEVAADDLARLVPFDATVVGGLSSFDVVRGQVDAATWKQLEEGALSEISSKVGVPAAMLTKLLEAYDGAMLFAMGGGTNPKGGVLLRVKDASLVTAALSAAKFEKFGGARSAGGEPSPPGQRGEDRWVRTDGGMTIHATLLEKERVVVLTNDEAALTAVLETKAGKKKSFTESPLFRRRGGDGLSVAVDLAALAANGGAGVAESGSKVLVGLSTDASGPKGGKLDVELTLVGARVPRVGQVVVPRPLAALAALPSGAVLGLEVSLQRAPGKTLRDFLAEMGKVDEKDLASEIDGALRDGVGSSLAELDGALGDELAIALYPSGEKLRLEGSPLEFGAVLIDVAVKDEAVAKRLVEALQKKMPPGALEVSVANGRLRALVGHAETVKRLSAAGGDKLGDSKAFQAAKVSASKPSQLAMYVDAGSIVKLLPAEAMSGADLAQLSDVSTLLALSFKPFDRGLDLAASGSGGAVAVVGALAVIGIFGVRSYLGSAKASEAKNTIGAIARGVVGAYEREDLSGGHKLCPSAPPVPAAVPRGTKVAASVDAGVDYQHPSWDCLRFAMSMPQYYQYEYRVGGPYKGPARGGPDAGPEGFEISAEGDLDGDGVTSLFTMTGKVDPTTKSVRLSTELFIADEKE
jgi:hypothetical protein